MSTNLTDEIRGVEAAAAKVVADAKAESLELLNKARNEAATRLKESKQSQFRDYRAKLAEVENEAAQESAKTVEAGKLAAAEFVKAHGEQVKKTAQWLAEEVVSRYGRC